MPKANVPKREESVREGGKRAAKRCDPRGRRTGKRTERYRLSSGSKLPRSDGRAQMGASGRSGGGEKKAGYSGDRQSGARKLRRGAHAPLLKQVQSGGASGAEARLGDVERASDAGSPGEREVGRGGEAIARARKREHRCERGRQQGDGAGDAPGSPGKGGEKGSSGERQTRQTAAAEGGGGDEGVESEMRGPALAKRSGARK